MNVVEIKQNVAEVVNSLCAGTHRQRGQRYYLDRVDETDSCCCVERMMCTS